MKINRKIVDFNIFEWRDGTKFHSVFRVLEVDEGVLFSDALEIHVLELPKLKRQPFKDNWTPIECWGLYLNNLEGEAMKMITAQEPMIGQSADSRGRVRQKRRRAPSL
ncbi:MAG: Rpn family recombination-promoting nuclease/putative transposase [Synergistaceae bacterium]|nr:Rpn family recombination-promoting nuclease/putative transposase [Synergistaceae bacterium]